MRRFANGHFWCSWCGTLVNQNSRRREELTPTFIKRCNCQTIRKESDHEGNNPA